MYESRTGCVPVLYRLCTGRYHELCKKGQRSRRSPKYLDDGRPLYAGLRHRHMAAEGGYLILKELSTKKVRNCAERAGSKGSLLTLRPLRTKRAALYRTRLKQTTSDASSQMAG